MLDDLELFHVKHHASALVGVSRETRERLGAFVALLRKWTSRVNLVAPGDLDHIWERHVEDSLQLDPYMPLGVTSAIDLGSGAGFPGLVLAIATGVHFHLIEADQRKAAFLREAVRVSGAAATIHAARIETLALAPSRLITARALARLPRLLALAAPLLAPDGVCLFLKGAKAAAEIAEFRTMWRARVETWPSRLGQGGTILRVQDLARA